MFLSPQELSTTMYDEIVAAITREDATIAQVAIDAALGEAVGYLSEYDTVTILAKTGADRPEPLLTFVKDMAVWHLVAIANPGTEMSTRRNRYERAVEWFKAVNRGDVVPNLPRKASETARFAIQSETKRVNHF